MRSAHSTLAVLLVVLAQSAYAEAFEGPVVRVVDGDSLIVIRGKEQIRVRLKEIDAPEHNQPFGKRSRQSLTDMCAKKRARVSWTERDRNGRTLGRVWCSGIDANAEQVRRGMAWVFDRYVKDRSLYPRKTPRDPHGSACGPTWLPFRLGNGAKIRARSNTGRRSSAPTHRAMNTAEAKQKVIDALLAKFRDALDLELVEGLPAPVYDFNPNGWMLFRTRNAPGMLGGSEYVAVRRETGEVRFLGRIAAD